MNKKFLKKVIKIIGILISIIIIFLVGIFIKQYILDKRINNDYSSIYSNDKYSLAVEVDGIKLVKQEISCGYATIEMYSNWLGETISEEYLYELNNKKISTAMGNGFSKEMNKQFSNHSTTRFANLTNSQLIDMIYNKLKQGIPVPIEFAALYESEDESIWTLHFALVTAINIGNDSVTLYNPYGYVETYTVKEFLDATRYDSYENMEYYLKIAFALGIFDKNTIYIVD